MKKLSILFSLLIVGYSYTIAQPQVIAHRGYWKIAGSAQNSIASLHKADSIGVYGAECDLYLTADSVVILAHDATITDNHWRIEKTLYPQIKELRLANNELLPTFEQYLKKMQQCKTRSILELKPHSTPELENRLIAIIMRMVDNAQLSDKVEYISFSKNIVKQIIAMQPTATVYYLGGNLSPLELKEMGCAGLDYHIGVMRSHPEWFKEAHDLGLKVNVWTVNSDDDMRYLLDKKADFITTDEPVKMMQLIAQ